MQSLVDLFRKGLTDAIHLGQIVNTGCHHTTQTTKAQQQLLTLGANPWNLFQRGCRTRLGTSRAVSGNGKAVCFVRMVWIRCNAG
jgi:hypothetical protein